MEPTKATTPRSESERKQRSATIAPRPARNPAVHPRRTLSWAMTAFIGPGGAASARAVDQRSEVTASETAATTVSQTEKSVRMLRTVSAPKNAKTTTPA